MPIRRARVAPVGGGVGAAAPAEDQQDGRHVRRLRSRVALIRAAQVMLAEGREHAAIGEITTLAGVGLGTFYNHFNGREDMMLAALLDAQAQWADVLDEQVGLLDDPVARFARSARLTGRLFGRYPTFGRLLRHEDAPVTDPRSLTARWLRDVAEAVRDGQWQAPDASVVVTMVTGAVGSLGGQLQRDPRRSPDADTDWVVGTLMRALGSSSAQVAALCAETVRVPLIDPVPGTET